MTLAEMFAEQDARTFEERRAEVVAIVSSAADFAGADYGLRAMYQHMCDAHDEREFDETFDQLVASMGETTVQVLQDSSRQPAGA